VTSILHELKIIMFFFLSTLNIYWESLSH